MAFKEDGLLLSAATSPSKKIIDYGYEVAELSRYFDWIAVMTYDFHGHWDKKTGHVSPMYPHPEDDNDYFNTVSFMALEKSFPLLMFSSLRNMQSIIG